MASCYELHDMVLWKMLSVDLKIPPLEASLLIKARSNAID